MTAYKNRKAALAVTAGLVGALTLGGAAVAVTPAFAAETGAQLQSDWTTGASVSKATNGQGQTVKDPSKAVFAQGKGKFLVPTQVTNKFGTVTNLKPEDYDFAYVNVANASLATSKAKGETSFKSVQEFFKTAPAGDYKVTVSDGSSSFSALFTIDSLTLKGAKVDGEVTYNGEKWYEAENDTIKIVDANGKAVDNDDWFLCSVTDANGNNVMNNDMEAGTYQLEVRAETSSDYEGSAVLTVTVGKLDLSKTSVTIDDGEYNLVDSSVAVSTLKIAGYTADPSDVSAITSLVAPDGQQVLNTSGNATKGVYTATVSANPVNANVTGTATVEFTNYEKTAGDLYYGKLPAADRDGNMPGITVNLTEGEAWDETELAVKLKATSAAYKGGLEVSYFKDRKKVDASALKEQGEYTVNVRVKPSKDADGKWVGGSFANVPVHVIGYTLSGEGDVAFYRDGKQVDTQNAQATYDGSDFLKSITAKVVDADGKEYEAGKDYELVATLDGEKVDSIVNAGDYKVAVKPITFELEDADQAVLSFHVEAVSLNRLLPDTADMLFSADANTGEIPHFGDADGNPWTPGIADNKFYLTYTGKDIELPGVKYEVKNASADGDTYEYKALDKSLYTVASVTKGGKTVDALNAAGDYKVTIALTDEAEGNYTLDSDTFEVTVAKQQSFADVAPEAWYAEPVAKAKDAGYVNGIAGTKLFAPEASITRADAVCILFNMAGGKLGSDEFQYSEDTGYVTGFRDVDGKAYYAKALAWAKASGVANGYGDGTFAPAAQITREEFAALLANYAKMSGRYEAPSTDELSKLGDASTVSAWAKDVVNWAVSEKVMGNGGFVAGQSDITRAEVAAMAVNFQPNKL